MEESNRRLVNIETELNNSRNGRLVGRDEVYRSCSVPVYEYDNSNDDNSKSDWTRAASQFVAIGASSLLTLSYGISIGFSTMLIGELQSSKSDIKVSIGQLTWISSMNYFSIPLGALASGWISKHLGRRNVLAYATIPYIISWLLFRFASNTGRVTPIFLAFLLLGITGGLIESPLQIYVTEISEPRLRGSISASVSATIMLGIFLQVLLGSFMNWRSLAFVNVVWPITALIALALVPESPYWLAGKGHLDKARRSLAWLRGWTNSTSINTEFSTILDSIKNEGEFSSTSNHNIIKLFSRRTVYLPFALITFSFFIACFNGSVSILSYSVVLFKEINAPLGEYTTTIILAGLQLIASILLVIVVPKFGKRKPTFVSLIIAGLALITVAIYIFLESHQLIIKSSAHNWIPTFSIILMIVSSALGIKSIPWILSGELFPNDIRGEAAGLVGSTCNIYAALASKVFLYMEQSMTLSGTFLFFALINFIGFGVLFKFMPETEGKSLIEIEKYFDNGKKSKVDDGYKVVSVEPS